MEMNGETGAKRKFNPVPVVEHRAKHPKPETTLTPGDGTPANGTVFNVDHENELDPSSTSLLPLSSSQPDSPEWQATIEKVVKCVVSIRFCQTCAFDTELSMDSEATGFVVDAERGYILTNRHVVCAGPFWGYCIFDNHEEVRRSRTAPSLVECRYRNMCDTSILYCEKQKEEEKEPKNELNSLLKRYPFLFALEIYSAMSNLSIVILSTISVSSNSSHPRSSTWI
jgi:hypothetical protein